MPLGFLLLITIIVLLWLYGLIQGIRKGFSAYTSSRFDYISFRVISIVFISIVIAGLIIYLNQFKL